MRATRFYPDMPERLRSGGAALRNAMKVLVDEGVGGLFYLEGEGLLPDDGEAKVDSSLPTDGGIVAYADAYEAVLRMFRASRNLP